MGIENLSPFLWTFLTIIAWLTSSEFLNHWVTIPTSSVVNTPPTIIQSVFKARTESNRNDPRPATSHNSGNAPGDT